MKKIVAVDFDGTIVDHRYPEIGSYVPHALDTLHWMMSQDYKLILWTIRSGAKLDDAIILLSNEGIDFWGINKNPEQKSWSQSPKAYAALFIDDAAYGAPLIHPHGFNRPCLDWSGVQLHCEEFFSRG